MSQAKDLLILTNGPGEISTWVLPVVQRLRAKLTAENNRVRISVILAPCPHSMGTEKDILESFKQIDRVQSAEHFLPFLLWGKTEKNWDWYGQGVVVFLGGDQFFPLIIGKRLKYKTVIYGEWDARWYQWIDYFGITREKILQKIPVKYHDKFTIVGDLMADMTTIEVPESQEEPLLEIIGLLPGSKGAKLAQGVPFMLNIAEKIKRQRPQIHFILPVAPTLTVTELAQWADPEFNPLCSLFDQISAQLITIDGQYFLQTNNSLMVELITDFPAHQFLTKCKLCLTTVGANTAQLGALAVPMVVLIPTYQLEAMRSWDGLPGLLANLPLVGTTFAKIINWLVLQYLQSHQKLYAWPNIYAQSEIVPELIGKISPDLVARQVLEYLETPETLQIIKQNLIKVRGEQGAIEKFTNLILKAL